MQTLPRDVAIAMLEIERHASPELEEQVCRVREFLAGMDADAQPAERVSDALCVLERAAGGNVMLVRMIDRIRRQLNDQRQVATRAAQTNGTPRVVWQGPARNGKGRIGTYRVVTRQPASVLPSIASAVLPAQVIVEKQHVDALGGRCWMHVGNAPKSLFAIVLARLEMLSQGGVA